MLKATVTGMVSITTRLDRQERRKQHHHDDGEEQSLVDGFQYAVDAVAYEGTLIVIGLEFIACRKLLPYLVRLAFHLLREIDQIHARLLHQIDKYGIIAISIDFQKLLLFLYLDSRYIAQTDNALCRRCGQSHSAILPCR